LNSVKGDLEDSFSIDKNKIRESIDIDAKIKNYNKNLNYNSFNHLKKLNEQNIEKTKNKYLIKNKEKNNSLINSNDSLDKKPLETQGSQHRKFSLEKRIRDFKNKIKNDMDTNTQLNEMKPQYSR